MTASEGEGALEVARRTLCQEVESIQAMVERLDEAFTRVATMLAGCEGLIFTTGVGTSGAVAERFAHILNCCGARSMFIHPSDSLHGHSGALGRGDVLVAISRGGSSYEVTRFAQIARDRGVPTACLVDNTESELARLSDVVLAVKTKAGYELMGYVATTSSLVQSAVCDALCAVVQAMKGYTVDAFKETHPEGGVGKQLHGE